MSLETVIEHTFQFQIVVRWCEPVGPVEVGGVGHAQAVLGVGFGLLASIAIVSEHLVTLFIV